ncbi:hypothetical protein Y1Q_0023869 [Alligator mississippiensis]|uniref:Uncharacterized protein n=1 Tax=Alligator mississippiensis TaxID=8496 RepID=A0A151MKI2_ALLMI|nr:hypothetical protein Y1Q_0023869 [Alligator mississippiensis]
MEVVSQVVMCIKDGKCGAAAVGVRTCPSQRSLPISLRDVSTLQRQDLLFGLKVAEEETQLKMLHWLS